MRSATRLRPRSRRSRVLDRLVARDPRLLAYLDEGRDGYLLELAPGYSVELVHDVRGRTVREVLEAVRLVRPCDCDGCRLASEAPR